MKRQRHPVILPFVMLGLLCLAGGPAQAQPPTPPPEYLWSIEESLWRGPSIGEDYTIELSGGVWDPIPAVVASSEQFGIRGSAINFGRDLGLSRTRHPEFRATYKPGGRHKLRMSLVPIQYSQRQVLERRLVFQGIAYDTGVPVASTLEWDAWRFGYEYDVVARERGYFGLILEAKYTRLRTGLKSDLADEYVRARAPIPALGGIMRVYPSRFTPITAEVTAFQLPDRVSDKYRAQYVDFDVYTTVNISRMFGVNLGYRSIDLSYLIEQDTGDLKLNGFYLSGTFRY